MAKTHQSQATNLRQKAENLLSEMKELKGFAPSDVNIQKLIHELDVHQVELEMQNEELILAKSAAEDSLKKYTEQYKLAPVGYFSLTNKGEILDLNLCGAAMLDKNHLRLKNSMFVFFVTNDTKPIFNLFLERVFKSGILKTCEVTLLTEGKLPMNVLLRGIISQKAEYCLLSVVDVSERKRAEEALRESEESYRKLFENHSAVKIILDPDTGAILDANDAAAQYYGWTREELKHMKIYQINTLSPEELNVEIERVRSERRIRFEFRHRRADGSIRDVEVCSSKIEMRGKDVLHSIIQDITERKQAELELIIANKELSFQNEEKEKRAEELIIANKELVHQNREKEKRAAELVIANKKLLFQNEEKEKRAAELIIANKELAHQNREKEKRAEELILANEALLQSEKNFRRSISESPLGIRILSVHGETIYANKAFLDIFEFNSLKEFTSTRAINRYTPESYAQHKERKEKRKNGHEEFDYEISIIRDNAEIRYIKVSRKEVLWNGIKHYQIINQDITEQKKLTLDLIEAKEHAEESNRLKSAFLANMSHEIRTPMNGILGFAEVLKEPGLSNEQQQEYISIIEKSGERMLNIINDIVTISKIESGVKDIHLSETNVNNQMEFVYNTMKLDAERKNLTLYFTNALPDIESVIKTDNEKFYSILTNLIKNAIKYTNIGSIEFGCHLKTDSVSEELEFFIKDTGIGIPKDRQEAIFERFIQADISKKRAYQGAGLGLAISKGYVEMLGGRIWVESEDGKGSTFYFTLPIMEKTDEKKIIKNEIPTSVGEPQRNKLKILIVEDDELSNHFISIAVQKFAKEIINVQSGTEAVKACLNNPDIDLILMDIQIPEIDGYQATQQIRQFNNKVIIIAQTAYALSGDREKSIDVGCNDYITKPVKKEELLSLIQKSFYK